MNENELPGYRIGFQDGFIEGQKDGLELAAKIVANQINPPSLIVNSEDVIIIPQRKEI